MNKNPSNNSEPDGSRESIDVDIEATIKRGVLVITYFVILLQFCLLALTISKNGYDVGALEELSSIALTLGVSAIVYTVVDRAIRTGNIEQ